MRYLKLGDKGASLFVDQRNLFSIANNQVVAVEDQLWNESKSAQRALSAGHIKEATEEEYNAFLAENKVEAKPAEPLVGVPNHEGSVGENSEDAKKMGVKDGLPDGQQTGTGGITLPDYEEFTDGELRDELKESSMPEEEKKNLTKLKTAQLIEAHKKYVVNGK